MKAARRELRKLQDTLDKEARGLASAPVKELVGPFFDAWLERREKGKDGRSATLDGYKRYVRRYLHPDPLAKMRVQDVKRSDVQHAINRLKSKLSASSIRQFYAILSGGFGYAIEQGRDTTPCLKINLPPVRLAAEKMPPARDIDKYIAHLDKCGIGLAARVIADLNVRRSEVLGLRWSDIDLDAEKPVARIERGLHFRMGEYFFEEPKSNAGRRTIPFADILGVLDRLRAHKKAQAEQRIKAGELWQGAPEREDDLIFTNSVGREWHPNYFTRRAGAAQTASGITLRQPLHGLRKYGLSLLGAGGKVQAAALAARAGHARPSFTADVYIKRLDGADAAPADALRDAFSPLVSPLASDTA